MKKRKNKELDLALVDIANRKKPDKRLVAIFQTTREAERKGGKGVEK